LTQLLLVVDQFRRRLGRELALIYVLRAVLAGAIGVTVALLADRIVELQASVPIMVAVLAAPIAVAIFAAVKIVYVRDVLHRPAEMPERSPLG
jgi:hypothetical protein